MIKEKFSKEEIIGITEANQFYNILSEEEKKKIPENFIKLIRKYSNSYIENKIKSANDINVENVSREGLKYMAYMCLYIA